MIAQWIDTRDRLPTENGDYLIQNVLGDVWTLQYTVECGWNSYVDSEGVLHTGNMDQKYVARWFDAPKPPAVPQEWRDEWLKEVDA